VSVPKGLIRLSLDPASGSKLFRPGVAILVKQLMLSGSPSEPANVSDLFSSYQKEVETILKISELTRDIDLGSESAGETLAARLTGKETTREWWALLVGASCEAALDALAKGSIEEFGWAIHRATAAHAMTVVAERVFEETLWQGYLANQVVHEATTAAAQTPGEAEAIKRLRPLFERLDEDTLHVWVTSGLAIGPRLGVSSLPEEVLLALARRYLERFEMKRQEEKAAREERRASRDLLIKWLSIALAVTTFIWGIVKVLL
jgi:hypothetical protein